MLVGSNKDATNQIALFRKAIQNTGSFSKSVR